MEFAVVFAVALTVLISERLPREAVADAPLRALLTWMTAVFISLLVWRTGTLVARRMRRDMGLSPTAAARWCVMLPGVFRGGFTAVWLAMVFWSMYCLRWPQVVRFNGGFNGWILVDELLIMSPVLLPLGAAWAAFFELDWASERRDEAAREPTSRERFRCVAVQARYYFGLFVLPALVLAGLQDVVAWTSFERSGESLRWMMGLGPLAVLVIAYPIALRRLWGLEPLPTCPLRDQLAATTPHLPPVGDILVWHTNLVVANAAMVGVTPWCRYAIVTDGLLAMLADDQIAAVLRHEAGHVRRRHMPLRMLLAGGPLWLWFATESLQPVRFLQLVTWWLALAGPFAGLLAAGALILFLAIALAWLARVQEHDADLWACGLTRAGAIAFGDRRNTHHLVAALEKLARGVPGQGSSSWLHPSIARRIEVLRRAVEDASYGQRVARFHDLTAACIVSAYILIPCWLLLSA